MEKLEITFNVKASDGGVLGSDISYPDILQLVPAATIPRIKIKICEHYLESLKHNLKNEMAVRTYLEIIFTFLRSATFSLQKICKHQQGFDEWWEKKRAAMAAEPILLKAVELRNVTEKEGFELTDFGVKVITRVDRKGKITNHVEPTDIVINDHTFSNIVDELTRAVSKIKEIVEDAHKDGFIKENRKPNKFFHEVFREDMRGNWIRIK